MKRIPTSLIADTKMASLSSTSETKVGYVWLYATEHRQDNYYTLNHESEPLDHKVILLVDTEGKLFIKIGDLAPPILLSTLETGVWNHVEVKQSEYEYTVYLNDIELLRKIIPIGGGTMADLETKLIRPAATSDDFEIGFLAMVPIPLIEDSKDFTKLIPEFTYEQWLAEWLSQQASRAYKHGKEKLAKGNAVINKDVIKASEVL